MKRSMLLSRLLRFMLVLPFIVSCNTKSAVQPVATSTFVVTPVIENTEEVRPEMPAYAKPGEYAVGFNFLPVTNGEELVGTYIWYPIQADGKPAVQDGPFPVFVFASGFSTPPVEGYRYLLSHIASYGFVSITWYPRAEDKTGDEQWIAPLAYRPLDLQRILDYTKTLTDPGGTFPGLIDMNKIAIAGHSMGGGTALISAGAEFDFNWCSAHKDLISKDEENTCLYYVNYQEEIATVLGLESIPTGKWPQMSDPRIVASIPMAPMGKLWGAEYDGVAAVKVPTLIMTGSNDTVLSPELGAYPIYDHLGSRKKTLVVLEEKDHNVFWGPGYTTGTIVDLDRIKHILTAFLLVEVKKDTQAAEVLSLTSTEFPGVRFETTEFK